MPVTWSSPNWVTVTSSASSTTTLYYPTATWTVTGSATVTHGLSTTIWPRGYTPTGWGIQPSQQRVPRVDPELFRQANDAVAGREAARPPEEIAARQERAMRAAEARQAAQTRGRDILLIVLDETQRAQYLATETFEVTGSAGNRYRIHRGNAGNIAYLDPVTGEERGRLCAHPSMREHWLPDQDVALAQLLALTSDEPAFVALANVHRGIRPPIPTVAGRLTLPALEVA